MSLEGFEPLQEALKRAPELVKSMSADAVQRSSFAVAQRAKHHAPVRSGDLKRAIDAAARGLSGRVGLNTDLKYWRFVEFGTKYMSAQPFFRPAADEESNEFVKRLRAIGQRLERDFSTGRYT
jgi:HK97 gp10 family phage protein